MNRRLANLIDRVNHLNRRSDSFNSYRKYWMFKAISLEFVTRDHAECNEGDILIRTLDVHSINKRVKVIPFNKRERSA